MRWCCASSIAACGGFKAAAVDGIGNIACGYQFACISTSRNGYFACICACGWCSQGNGVHTYFVWVGAGTCARYGYGAVIGSLNFGFGSIQLCHVNGIGVFHPFGNIAQGNGFAWIATHQIYGIAWRCGVVACGISIAQWSVKFHFGYAIGAGYVGYCALTINKVDGVAMSHEVFVCAVTLYGKACVQYVVNGGGVVAFVTCCQGSTIVTARIASGIARIGKVALHVGQCGRFSGVTGCILHAGNHVAGSHLGTAAVRLGVEVAVSVFVHFVAAGIGVHHRGLGVLYHGLGIQCVSVGLVTVGSVHILFHGQTVTGSKGNFLTGFNGGGGGRSPAGQSAASSGLETAVVDGVGNITRCGQFACVGCGWWSNFAVVGYGQWSSGYGLRSNLTRHSFQLSNVYYISIFLTCSHPRNLTSNIICNIAYRYCCFSRSPSSIIFSCNCIQRISSFHTSSGRSNRLITHSNSTIYGCFGVRTQGYSISNGSRSCSSSIICTGANGNIVIAIQVACSSPTNHGIMLTLRFQPSLFTNTNTGITYIAIHGLGAYCNIVVTIAIDCCRIANRNSASIIACTLTCIKTNRYTIHSTSLSAMPCSKRTGSSCRTIITYRNCIITCC